MSAPNWIMGRDQYGQVYHNLGPHPRKALMERIGVNNARKMYVGLKSGGARHVGYVVGRFWVTLYNVAPWERAE